jgi:acetyl-CoA carboxylase biotin carboxyl carrier protein
MSRELRQPKRERMAKLDVDTKLIEALAELLQRSGLSEIEVSEGDARIRVARQLPPQVSHVSVPAPSAAAVAEAPASAGPDPAHPGAVTSPMVGTAYLTPEPGAQPFVSEGGEVQEGQTLLIIEAMKVMNPIRAPRSGRVAAVYVTNGAPVEYGEVLMIIE